MYRPARGVHSNEADWSEVHVFGRCCPDGRSAAHRNAWKLHAVRIADGQTPKVVGVWSCVEVEGPFPIVALLCRLWRMLRYLLDVPRPQAVRRGDL